MSRVGTQGVESASLMYIIIVWMCARTCWTTVVFMDVLSNLAFSSVAIIMISCVCICQFDSNSASGGCVGVWVCEGEGP